MNQCPKPTPNSFGNYCRRFPHSKVGWRANHSCSQKLNQQESVVNDHLERIDQQIHQLITQVRVLEERDAKRERELTELNGLVQKEREERVRLQIENAALKQQLQDHVAQYQEGDRRRWGLIVMLIGAVLSLASGLIVTLARK